MEVKGDSERMLYHLVYCLPLYGGMDVGDLRELEELQKKAAQAVTLSLPGSERNPMFNRLSWLAVNQLIFYHLVVSIFKIRSNKEPEHLAVILSKDSINSRIIVPNLDLTIVQKSFSMRGADS